MSDLQITPGPWKLWELAPDSDPMERNIVVAADGETEVTGIIPNRADALAIADLPELHKVCRRLVNLISDDDPIYETYKAEIETISDILAKVGS